MGLFVTANIYFLFELVTLILCVVYSKRIKHSIIKPLPVFILAIVLLDILAMYRKEVGLPVGWIINSIVIPFEFCYLLLFIRTFLIKKTLKKLALLPLLAYIVLFIVDEIVYKKTYARLYLLSYLAGVIGLLLVCILYGYELLGSDKLFRFYRDPAWWICSGALLFYLGTLPFHLAWNLDQTGEFSKVIANTKVIFYFLMCAMYSFFSISVLCLKPTKN